eukprot:315676_1
MKSRPSMEMIKSKSVDDNNKSFGISQSITSATDISADDTANFTIVMKEPPEYDEYNDDDIQSPKFNKIKRLMANQFPLELSDGPSSNNSLPYSLFTVTTPDNTHTKIIWDKNNSRKLSHMNLNEYLSPSSIESNSQQQQHSNLMVSSAIPITKYDDLESSPSIELDENDDDDDDTEQDIDTTSQNKSMQHITSFLDENKNQQQTTDDDDNDAPPPYYRPKSDTILNHPIPFDGDFADFPSTDDSLNEEDKRKTKPTLVRKYSEKQPPIYNRRIVNNHSCTCTRAGISTTPKFTRPVLKP